MDLNLSGRHALVRGASEGIGRATAHELALLGADVTLMSRREDALHAVRRELADNGSQTHRVVAADDANTQALGEALAALAGEAPVHILINNSGGPPGGRAIDADPQAFIDAYTQHLIANQMAVQAVVPGMRAANWGRIVNVISTSVREPIANLGVSNTVRGAVAGWAKTLSRELAPFGITVNNVLPGFTETARIAQIVDKQMRASGKSEAAVREEMAALVPVGRFAQAHELGGVIAFLCTPAAAYVNGVSLPVDGGRMHSI